MLLFCLENADGFVGEVVLYAFTVTLGPINFNPAVYHAWSVLYSRLLMVVVPIAISLELQDQESADKSRQRDYFEAIRSSSDYQMPVKFI